MNMRKIIIFNGYYYPSKNCGGPITSIENIVNSCCDEFEFYIVCYNHDFNSSEPFKVELNTWVKVGNANVLYVAQGYLDFSNRNLEKLFKDTRPDLIWFSGVLTPNNKIATARVAKRLNIPVLFSPRGELSADRVAIKKYKKEPYLRLISLLGVYKGCYFHGTSDDEEVGIRKYFHPDNNHIFRAANIAITQQPELFHIEKKRNELNVFFFSRIHEVKNIMFGIKCLGQCKSIINLDVYGPIESENYWKECVELTKSFPPNITVNYGGILDYTNKSVTIQKHHCFLFPTINENYGHVIAESLANSRPLVLSKGTTPWDDLDGKAGYVINLDNPDGFTTSLDRLAEMDQEDFDCLIQSTRQYFITKMKDDDAVTKHKEMFKTIIRS